jgi:hypothetical protein
MSLYGTADELAERDPALLGELWWAWPTALEEGPYRAVGPSRMPLGAPICSPLQSRGHKFLLFLVSSTLSQAEGRGFESRFPLQVPEAPLRR